MQRHLLLNVEVLVVESRLLLSDDIMLDIVVVAYGCVLGYYEYEVGGAGSISSILRVVLFWMGVCDCYVRI